MRPNVTQTALDEVLLKLAEDKQFRSEFAHDRGAVLRRYPLSREHQAALLALDLPLFAERMVQLSDTASGTNVDTII